MSSLYPIGLKYGDRAPTPSGIEHGADVEVPDGTRIYAPVPYGEVVYARNNATTGGTVGIFSGGHTYWYGHLKSFGVKEGDTVSEGDFLGLTGGGAHDPMRGDATGPHLWVAVSDGFSKTLSNLINPLPFLDQSKLFRGSGESSAVNAALLPPAATSPTQTQPVSNFLGIPLGAYLKIAGGGLILLIGVVIVLAAIGLRSGRAEEFVAATPIAGPAVKRVRTKQKQRVRREYASRQKQSTSEVKANKPKPKTIHGIRGDSAEERDERIGNWFKSLKESA